MFLKIRVPNIPIRIDNIGKTKTINKTIDPTRLSPLLLN